MKRAALMLRFVRRELRSTEARILVLALALAVASVGAVAMFADRVQSAFVEQANVLLGADAMISGDRPLPPAFAEAARAFGLTTTESTRFGSMVSVPVRDGGEVRSVLADVKAVAAPYPLRGTLEARGPTGARVPLVAQVRPGEVFVDERLASRLGVRAGERVELGRLTPRIAQVFAEEPEVAGNFITMAPKVLMAGADVEASGLIAPGSRATYRLQVAGPRAGEFVAAMRPKLGPGQRLETIRELRPEVRSTLERAEQFLGLAASFAVFLAVVAIVLTLRRYLKREIDTATLFRTLGAGERQTLVHFIGQFCVLALLACALGVALAYAAQAALAWTVRGLFESALPPAGWWPLAKAFATGFVLLLGFALPPLVALAATPPVRALRRDLPPLAGSGALAMSLGGIAVLAVVLMQAQDWATGVVFVGALLALVALATLLAGALLWLIRRAVRSGGLRWLGRAHSVSFGLANLDRRRLSTALQIACLGLGVMTLITVGFVRTDLFSAWQKSLPPDAPNQFLINIQADQIAPIQSLLPKDAGEAAAVYPMVRARLVELNGRPISAKDFVSENAKRLIDREFNLSSASTLPRGNRLVAGAWPDATERDVMSIEDGIAATLGLKLGDEVTFDVAGETLRVRITSLRKVDWDSFRVNFFALLPQASIAALPKSYITAFHLPPGDTKTLAAVVAAAPNVLAIDVSEMMQRIRSIVDQVARALEFVFVFTLLAGLLTLYTAVIATQDERRYDTAVIRTLGGTARQVRRALLAEFVTLGAATGVLGVGGAVGLTWALAARLLKIEFVPSPGVWVAGFVLAVALTLLAGWLGTRSVLSTPPLQVLRESA